MMYVYIKMKLLKALLDNIALLKHIMMMSGNIWHINIKNERQIFWQKGTTLHQMNWLQCDLFLSFLRLSSNIVVDLF